MYWTLTTKALDETLEQRGLRPAGRFVLHRHTDVSGAHLDLRIESGEALQGWRIDATELGEENWATEKRPHPKRWLDEPGDATALDAGQYAIESESREEVVLVLEGRERRLHVHARRVAAVPARAVGAIRAALERAGATLADVPTLIEDGCTARGRAIARLCGLGRELDGAAFDEDVWRKTLRGLSLEEIHAQLRPFEVRFDERYPAEPVSRPEPLTDDAIDRSAQALAILRG